MKLLFLIFTVPTLVLSLTSCDTISNDIQSNKQLEVVDNTGKGNVITETPTEINDVNFEDYSSSEWEPRMIKTPVSQLHKSFNLPKSNVQKIKTYFYKDVDETNNVEKKLDESDYILEGYVSYSDNTFLNYSFEKEENNYLGTNFYLSGNYELSRKFSEFHKGIIYKMLEVSGAENPKNFFQELIDSPKITKYTGCTVQIKEIKYGVIDLTSCEEDDATVLALYNPELE